VPADKLSAFAAELKEAAKDHDTLAVKVTELNRKFSRP
jgi:hypothetical protein